MSDRDTDGAVDPEGAVPAPVPFLDLLTEYGAPWGQREMTPDATG